MGSPLHESDRETDEIPHRRRIGRTFAIATKEVTVAQYEEFLRAHPDVRRGYSKQYSPVPEGPIISVSWYKAAMYCRWLSEQEGIAEEEMCYPPIAEIVKCADGQTALMLPRDYLSRTGYRLPSEAEWELACRASSKAKRCFGSSTVLLPRYAWYVENSQRRTWPVGQKRPNDLGLFDVYGNVWEWCWESAWIYKIGELGNPVFDPEDQRPVTDRLYRALRRGSFNVDPRNVRSANRYSDRPTGRSYYVGFRVSRTYY